MSTAFLVSNQIRRTEGKKSEKKHINAESVSVNEIQSGYDLISRGRSAASSTDLEISRYGCQVITGDKQFGFYVDGAGNNQTNAVTLTNNGGALANLTTVVVSKCLLTKEGNRRRLECDFQATTDATIGVVATIRCGAIDSNTSKFELIGPRVHGVMSLNLGGTVTQSGVVSADDSTTVSFTSGNIASATGRLSFWLEWIAQ